MPKKITIGWLYPELMNTYGDRGNILVLQQRIKRRGIGLETKQITTTATARDLADCDLLFMGGAQDQQQAIIKNHLLTLRGKLREMVEVGTPGLYICGAYQLLGEYYLAASGEKIAGIGIFDLYTENHQQNKQRLVGNIVATTKELGEGDQKIIGFENHGGRTFLGKEATPLARIIHGYGNNGQDGYEGVIHKNSIGSYLHGPLLPKNSFIADYLIQRALEKKYAEPITLAPLPSQYEERSRKKLLKLYG